MADIDRVLKAVFMIEKFATEIDDEFVDRLNRMYVPSILVVFSVIMSIKQFVGDPINCWCPAEFVKAHVVSATINDRTIHWLTKRKHHTGHVHPTVTISP
jgi:hypothetical protein